MPTKVPMDFWSFIPELVIASRVAECGECNGQSGSYIAPDPTGRFGSTPAVRPSLGRQDARPPDLGARLVYAVAHCAALAAARGSSACEPARSRGEMRPTAHPGHRMSQ
jgi:hypothetical protein